MPRTVYEVLPDGSDWIVKRRGATRASYRFDTKAPAVSKGRELAKNNRPSQLVIRRADGTIEDEFTYNGDPFPPAG